MMYVLQAFMAISFASALSTTPEKSYQPLVRTLPAEFFQYHKLYDRKRFPESSFGQSTDQQPLFNSYYTNGKSHSTALVILPGMGETGFKNFELGLELQNAPLTPYFFDPIGHGYSYHMTPDATRKVHIDDFNTYVDTLAAFLRALKAKHESVWLQGHSMGGHICLLLALKHPELIDKLVLTAPMIQLEKKFTLLKYTYQILSWLPQESFPPFSNLYKKGPSHYQNLTTSQKRADILTLIRGLYPAIERHTVTLGWLYNAFSSMNWINKQPKKSLKIPTLIIRAGKDTIVSLKTQREFCDLNSENCKLKDIPESRHEIPYESDKVRQKVMNEITSFFGIPSIVVTSSEDY